MAGADDLRAEIDALQAEIAKPAAPREEPIDPLPSSDIERLLRELQDTLSEAADSAEAAVTAHPLAAIASAFLLGIVVGRILGRS